MKRVLYRCGVCNTMVGADVDFVNALNPATCPICLRSTWLVRPGIGERVESCPASREAEEWLSLLNAEALEVARTIRKALAESRRPTPEWN